MLSKSLQKRNKILSLKLKSKILKTAFKKKKATLVAHYRFLTFLLGYFPQNILI